MALSHFPYFASCRIEPYAYIVGYLKGATGGFGASYIFMAGSLLLSVAFTILATREDRHRKVVSVEGCPDMVETL